MTDLQRDLAKGIVVIIAFWLLTGGIFALNWIWPGLWFWQGILTAACSMLITALVIGVAIAVARDRRKGSATKSYER